MKTLLRKTAIITTLALTLATSFKATAQENKPVYR